MAVISLSYRRRLFVQCTDYQHSTQEGIWESTFCFLRHLGLDCDSFPLPEVARWIRLCPPGPWASVLPSHPIAQIASLPAFLTSLVTRAAASDTNTHRPFSEVERLCQCQECSQSNKAPWELAHLVESKETWHTDACLGSAI